MVASHCVKAVAITKRAPDSVIDHLNVYGNCDVMQAIVDIYMLYSAVREYLLLIYFGSSGDAEADGL